MGAEVSGPSSYRSGPLHSLQHPTEMVYSEIFLLIGLCAMSLALPTSLLEDMKDAQLQAPIRANKVKRAQEFIMFGNQQNRASNNFGSKTEKRATELDDNSLSDEEVPLPTLVSDMDEHVYNNNQLGTGKEEDRSQLSRDLYYNVLLRNLDLTQSLHNDPAYNLDLPYYNIMDSRAKREAKTPKGKSLRLKREYTMTPEELLSLVKLWEMEKMNAKVDPRNRVMWPMYDEPEDYEEDEDVSPYASPDNNNHVTWYDGPVFNQHAAHERELAHVPRPHKRFMVSKRSEVGVAPFMPFQARYDDIPLHRRFLI